MRTVRADRDLVYDALDGERDYQENKWPDDHTVEEYLLYMEDYLNEAKHSMCRTASVDCVPVALDIIRKVTALGVACMENNGVVFRGE